MMVCMFEADVFDKSFNNNGYGSIAETIIL